MDNIPDWEREVPGESPIPSVRLNSGSRNNGGRETGGDSAGRHIPKLPPVKPVPRPPPFPSQSLSVSYQSL